MGRVVITHKPGIIRSVSLGCKCQWPAYSKETGRARRAALLMGFKSALPEVSKFILFKFFIQLQEYFLCCLDLVSVGQSCHRHERVPTLQRPRVHDSFHVMTTNRPISLDIIDLKFSYIVYLSQKAFIEYRYQTNESLSLDHLVSF